MSYITEHLEHDERIIAKARYHRWFDLRQFGLLNMFNQVWVTDRRILHKSGILAARTQSISLAQIESKDVEQSVWGRIFGYGDLVIHGSGHMMFRFENLANPTAFARAIGRPTVKAGGRGGNARASVLPYHEALPVKRGGS